jgi:hypothetical protein
LTLTARSSPGEPGEARMRRRAGALATTVPVRRRPTSPADAADHCSPKSENSRFAWTRVGGNVKATPEIASAQRGAGARSTLSCARGSGSGKSSPSRASAAHCGCSFRSVDVARGDRRQRSSGDSVRRPQARSPARVEQFCSRRHAVEYEASVLIGLRPVALS